MVDALQGQFRLLPECADQLGSALHGFQTTTSEVADFSKMRRTQVGDLMLLQIRPDRLDRIELGSVRRQEGDGDAPVLFIEPLPERAALVGTDAIPHDQQWPAGYGSRRRRSENRSATSSSPRLPTSASR